MAGRSFPCIVCPRGCKLDVEDENGEWVVQGFGCALGRSFGIKEMTRPTRTICSTIASTNKNYPVVPVRTDREVPLEDVFRVVESIRKILLDRDVSVGDVVVSRIAGTEANLVATASTNMIVEGSPYGRRPDSRH